MNNILIIRNSGFNFIKDVAEEPKMNATNGWVPTLLKIFSFLDNLSLYSLKSVCKNFKKLISLDVMWMQQFKNRIAELKNLERELENKKTQYKEKELGILDKEKMIRELEAKQSDSPETIQKLELLKKEKAADELELKEIVTDMNKGYEILNVEGSKLKMTKGLLGKHYVTLPVLIPEKIRKTCIDFIKPESMSHSIMRGKDAFKRDFISIRAIDKKTQKLCVQTFYQVSPQASPWRASGASIIVIPGEHFIMSEGKPLEKSYEELKELVEKGENESYKLA